MNPAILAPLVGALLLGGGALAFVLLPEPPAPAEDDPAIRKLGLDAWREELSRAPGALLLDVRMEHEFKEGHIPGAVNLWVETLAKERTLEADPDEPIFVYCKLGIRAARAAEILADMGHTNVVVLVDGGYPDWAAAGHPTAWGA